MQKEMRETSGLRITKPPSCLWFSQAMVLLKKGRILSVYNLKLFVASKSGRMSASKRG